MMLSFQLLVIEKVVIADTAHPAQGLIAATVAAIVEERRRNEAPAVFETLQKQVLQPQV